MDKSGCLQVSTRIEIFWLFNFCQNAFVLVSRISIYRLAFKIQETQCRFFALGINLSTQENQSYTAYAEDLRARLAHAYDLASRGMQKESRANKKRYDTYCCNATLQVQNRVLVRNLSVRGKQKLADRWEDTPYVVVRKIPDLPVYAARLQLFDTVILLVLARSFSWLCHEIVFHWIYMYHIHPYRRKDQKKTKNSQEEAGGKEGGWTTRTFRQIMIRHNPRIRIPGVLSFTI